MPVLSKKGSSNVCGCICSVWPSWVWEGQQASPGNSVSWSLGHSSRSRFHRRSPEHQELRDLKLVSTTISLLSWQRLSFWSSLSTLGTNFAHIFRIFISWQIFEYTLLTLTLNCALIVFIDTRRSLSIKFFIRPINTDILISLLLSSSFIDSLPSLNLLCHSKTDARCIQGGWKAVWIIPYVSVAFCPSLKHNFIAYHSSKVSSCPDCIF